eukprot:338799_1
MNSSSNELLASHARLLGLEESLAKERKNLIPHYNDGSNASNASYFPYASMLEKFSGFADEYTSELAKFKNLVTGSLKQRQNNNRVPEQVNVDNNNHITSTTPQSYDNTPSSFNNNNMTNVQREIASLNNNNNGYNNGNYINQEKVVQQVQQ